MKENTSTSFSFLATSLDNGFVSTNKRARRTFHFQPFSLPALEFPPKVNTFIDSFPNHGQHIKVFNV